MAAIAASGADAVMSAGRPKAGPGYRDKSPASFRHQWKAAPSLAVQLDLIEALYDEMLSHHGVALGRRHARKHLGWALDAAAETSMAPNDPLEDA